MLSDDLSVEPTRPNRRRTLIQRSLTRPFAALPRGIVASRPFSFQGNAMSELNMFIPITKVDAAQRLVYGIATAEITDRSGEICDYETTKPFYEKWSEEIAKSTGGKSLGNLRAMHGSIAAGKITALQFNDARKQIEVCAKIVDDAEWLKVREGVYTGFSQGGAYVRRWTDADGQTRYTAQPLEISLVDLPCLPQARFEMIKADGTREWRAFTKDYDTISRLAAILNDLEDLQSDARLDPLGEMGGADLVAQLQDLLGRAVTVLRQLVDHETSEYAGSDYASTKPDPANLQQMRISDAASALAKIGARNNAEDQSRIQAVHDTSVELGAACHSHKHVASGGLEKRFDALATKLDDLLARVKNIESQPLPLPLAGRARPVAKSEDGAFASEMDEEPKDRDALALAAIKKAQRCGQNFFTR